MKATKREAIVLERKTLLRAIRIVGMQRRQFTRETRYIPSMIVYGFLAIGLLYLFSPKVEAPTDYRQEMEQYRHTAERLYIQLLDCQKNSFVEPRLLPVGGSK